MGPIKRKDQIKKVFLGGQWLSKNEIIYGRRRTESRADSNKASSQTRKTEKEPSNTYSEIKPGRLMDSINIIKKELSRKGPEFHSHIHRMRQIWLECNKSLEEIAYSSRD